MLPWKTIIQIEKGSERPVYLQLTDAVISEIKCGILKPGTKMPGTRTMSESLKLNRQTVVKAYDELYSQGWLESIVSKGTFVSRHLPEVRPQKLPGGKPKATAGEKTGFKYRINTAIHPPAK